MTLYLLPNLLGPIRDHHLFLPISVDQAVAKIDGLIAESEGEGRRYLKRFATQKKPQNIPIALLTKKKQDIDFLLEPLLAGESWGVVSDCGLPCLADPGAALVLRARELHITVEAFTGPSSITHALMLSGLSAQRFTFQGYLPKQPQERHQALRQMDKLKEHTHIFIEAPYRNVHTFTACLSALHEQTLLCVASSLTLPEERVYTTTVGHWKTLDSATYLPHLLKKPTIFIFYATKP